MPIGNRDITGVTQTAQTCHATCQPVTQVVGWHQVLDGIDRADRHIAFDGGKGVNLCPEANRIPQFTLGNLAQPFVVLT